MRYFSVQDCLLFNTYEFCPNANVSPEWQRLLYEEFYNDWLNDEANLSDPVIFMEAQYEAFMTVLKQRVVEQTPAFNSKNIDKTSNGKYRVRIQVEGTQLIQTFNSLDEARLFRNEMLKQPKIGGAMSEAFTASLNDKRNLLTAA